MQIILFKRKFFTIFFRKTYLPVKRKSRVIYRTTEIAGKTIPEPPPLRQVFHKIQNKVTRFLGDLVLLASIRKNSCFLQEYAVRKRIVLP
ncbi:MAG: hypothetical protein EGP82_02285 [Odoribacter splanchnicus]|nr:hypothetical protein [Odoribacter splanchnicus]